MAGEVVSQSEWFSWSLNQLAREFGIARETVQSRLRSADVRPSGERRGFPVYSVSASARAILLPSVNTSYSQSDPENMSPKERADWYKSEKDRLIVQKELGLLVSTDETREQMAYIAKSGLQVLETLPDILERDFQLDAEIISNIEEKIDSLRDQWAEMLQA